jgi:hypothetical protein
VPRRKRMSTRNRLLFFVTAWLIVLMPFLFWWNTWFGRELSDKQLTAYLNDQKRPRHIQHALVQVGERIARHDPDAARWYPDLVRLSSNPVDEVRNTDAWVMGQDTGAAQFHDALRKMLADSSPLMPRAGCKSSPCCNPLPSWRPALDAWWTLTSPELRSINAALWPSWKIRRVRSSYALPSADAFERFPRPSVLP